MRVLLAIVATVVAWSAVTPAQTPHAAAIAASEYQARRAALAKAIGELLDDPARRASTAVAARRSVLARYTVAKLTEGIASLYRELLQGGPSAPPGPPGPPRGRA